MSFLDELEELNKRIKDVEYKVQSMKIGIEKAEREFALLLSLEMTLIENIKNLKDLYLIVTVGEFKRAKSDLDKTKRRLGILRIEIDSLIHSKKRVEDFLDSLRKDYRHTLNASYDNVVKIDFKKKK